MPGRALRLARRVLDSAHLVEKEERVGDVAVRAGERPPDGEAGAFEVGRRGDDLADRTERGRAGVRPRDARQDEEVGDGYGGHQASFDMSGRLIIVATSTSCRGTRGEFTSKLTAGRVS